jgi:hypothetical protein
MTASHAKEPGSYIVRMLHIITHRQLVPGGPTVGSSLTFLVRHFLNHPEHRFLLYKQITHNPQLSAHFERLQESLLEEEWLEWFELLEHAAPSLTKVLTDEVASLLYGSSPELDAFPPESTAEPTVAENNQSLRDVVSNATLQVNDRPHSGKQKIALNNSKQIYSSGEGWHKFQINLKTGQILPLSESVKHAIPLRCKLALNGDRLYMDELHLTFSDHRSLVYRERKWYWNNTRQIERAVRMDIRDISRVLQADVVDLLLDLVSPGLIFQGADAYLSVSVISDQGEYQKLLVKEVTDEEDSAPTPRDTQTNPPPVASHHSSPPTPAQETQVRRNPASIPLNKPLPADASFINNKEKIVLTRSPFAFAPDAEEPGESTDTRRAFREPKSAPPKPKELIIERIHPMKKGWFGRVTPETKEKLATLTINASHIFKDVGIQITFMLETTSEAIFPWVRLTRSAKMNTEAEIKLVWNGEQEQRLPPDYRTTGALSRSQFMGNLRVHITLPDGRKDQLLISWVP